MCDSSGHVLHVTHLAQETDTIAQCYMADGGQNIGHLLPPTTCLAERRGAVGWLVYQDMSEYIKWGRVGHILVLKIYFEYILDLHSIRG